jgi:hypothetical protein
MNAQVQLSRMVRQSVDVLTHPSVRTFNYYGARASDSDALLYVTIGAVLVGLVSSLIFGSLDVIGLAYAIVNRLFTFYIFAGVTYFVGRQFGGIGGFPTVAYCFALFYVPILVLFSALIWALLLLHIGLLPLQLIRLAELAVLAFYAYLAIQAAHYLRRPRDAALAVLIGLAALWLIQLVFGGAALGV